MIYLPSKQPEDWKQFLVEPDKQWKDGYSAKTLAVTWQNASGLPHKVRQVLESYSGKVFSKIEMLLGIPEYKVSLPGGGRASQNDLFVLARTEASLLSIMVEGKVFESFGPLVENWKVNMSSGKKERLGYLCNLLALDENSVDRLRYQLLHRSASAIITAKQFHCNAGLVLVHSFNDSDKSFNDYEAFLNVYGLRAKVDEVVGPIILSGIPMYWAWVKG